MISQFLNDGCWYRLARYLAQFQFNIIICKEIAHCVNQICSGHNFLVIPVSPWFPDGCTCQCSQSATSHIWLISPIYHVFSIFSSLCLLYLTHRFTFQLHILVPINIAICLIFPWAPYYTVSSYQTLFSKSFISWDNGTDRLSPRYLSQVQVQTFPSILGFHQITICLCSFWPFVQPLSTFQHDIPTSPLFPSSSINTPQESTSHSWLLDSPFDLLVLSIPFWPLVCSHHGLLVSSPIRTVILSPHPLLSFACVWLP